MTTYILGGGCFWCLDAVFRRLKGVTEIESGYAGGDDQPNYYRVATGTTKHAEVVKVTFDETVIPEATLLDIFFLIHDPTTLNRQGADVGPQYRSIMFYKDLAQENVFEVIRLETFYRAEDEHQDYFNKNPESGYCSIVIAPKVNKARKAYATWFKEE